MPKPFLPAATTSRTRGAARAEQQLRPTYHRASARHLQHRRRDVAHRACTACLYAIFYDACPFPRLTFVPPAAATTTAPFLPCPRLLRASRWRAWRARQRRTAANLPRLAYNAITLSPSPATARLPAFSCHAPATAYTLLLLPAASYTCIYHPTLACRIPTYPPATICGSRACCCLLPFIAHRHTFLCDSPTPPPHLTPRRHLRSASPTASWRPPITVLRPARPATRRVVLNVTVTVRD